MSTRKCKFYEQCRGNAQVLIKHSGLAVCKAHFLSNIEERVVKTVERYHMLPRFPGPTKERWVIAMSGGKDSQVLAEIVAKKLRDRVELLGVYVDVGVRGNSYTDQSRRVVEETCARLSIPCTIVDLRNDGMTMDDIHVTTRCRRGGNRTECSACGIVKRYHINRAAVELKAEKVATGHHLTDEATTLLSNFLNINTDQLLRGMPWEKRDVVGGSSLLPRVKPFLEVSEEETALYAHLGAVPHVATQCPYAVDATSTVLKKHMLAIEKDRPGTMLRLVRGFNKELFPLLSAGKAKAPTVQPQQQTGDDTDDVPAKPAPVDGEAAVEVEESGDGVVLKPCDKCGYPTIPSCPLCAYCKLQQTVTEYKKDHLDLFGGPAASEKAHTCEICCPPEPGKDLEDAAGAPEGEGVTVTTDMVRKPSNRWKKRQRQWEKTGKSLPRTTGVGAPAADAPAAPAKEEPVKGEPAMDTQ